MYSIDFYFDELFPDDIAGFVLKKGGLLNILWSATLIDSFDPFSVQDIRDGVWDDHIRSWAVKAKSYEYPIFITFAPHFNDRTSGSYVVRDVAAQKDEYIEAFRHVVTLFEEVEAHNVLWVWQPTLTQSSLTLLELNDMYPGDKYVDWLGVGYRAGEGQPELHSILMNLSSVFSATTLKKPILVDLIYQGASDADKVALLKAVSEVSKEETNVRGLILDISGVTPYVDINPIIDAPIFHADRDAIQRVLE